MNVLSVIELILTLLDGVAAAFHKEGLTELAAGIQAAITSLEGVKGSLVTKEQVDSLRIYPQW
jgi:hypothetical protein